MGKVGLLAIVLCTLAIGTSNAQENQPQPQQTPAAEEPTRHSMPPGAKVYIIWPPNGAVIDGGKLWVRMGLTAGGVAPAG